MATFQDVMEQDGYKNAPPEIQSKIASDFFTQKVASQKGYSDAPPDVQTQIKSDFYKTYGLEEPLQASATKSVSLQEGLGNLGNTAGKAISGVAQAAVNPQTYTNLANQAGNAIQTEIQSSVDPQQPITDKVVNALPFTKYLPGAVEGVRGLANGVWNLGPDIVNAYQGNQDIQHQNLIPELPQPVQDYMKRYPVSTFAGEQLPFAFPIGEAAQGANLLKSIGEGAAIGAIQDNPNGLQGRLENAAVGAALPAVAGLGAKALKGRVARSNLDIPDVPPPGGPDLPPTNEVPINEPQGQIELPEGPQYAQGQEIQPIETQSRQAQNAKKVTLYRGTVEGRSNDLTKDTFWSPDQSVAEAYAKGATGSEKTQVLKHDVQFDNLFESQNWMTAKHALGLPYDTSMPDLLKAIQAKGYDGVAWKGAHGLEYVKFGQSTSNSVGKAGFVQNVQKAKLSSPELKQALDQNYQKATNKETLLQAQTKIEANPEAAYDEVLHTEEPTHETYAMAQDLMRRYQNEGNFDRAIEIAERVAERATKQGQAIQALSMWGRLTPEGALVAAERIAQKAGKGESKPAVKKLYNAVDKFKETADARTARRIRTLAQKTSRASFKKALSKLSQEELDALGRMVGC